MNNSNFLLLLALAIPFAGCSSPKYSLAPEKDSAKISFSSLSDDFPELELRLRGKTYSISPEMINTAKPGASDKKLFDIPANEEVVLFYEASEITDIIVTPAITSFANPNPDKIAETGKTTVSIGHQIDVEQQYKVNFCTTDFAFKPKTNKHYEVFLEQADGIICRVHVRQVISSRDGGHDIYKQLKSGRPAS